MDPKVMDVLLRLVAAEGEVVSRESLMADVWEGTVVTDFALSRCIYQLRKNLRRVAEAEDSPIETLPKRGYRLTWLVIPNGAAPSEPPGTARRWPGLLPVIVLVGIAALVWLNRSPLIAPAPRVAVAVLPFSDLSRSGDLGYFGDGVATDLMAELGHIREIDVLARTSSFHFRGSELGTAEIAKALDATYLVEGSVNGDDGTVQVTAALVDTANGGRVWTGTFNGSAGQSFSAQQDIARDIAGYLEVSLGDPRRHGGTTSFDAFDAYARATTSVNNVVDDGGADIYLDQALAYDPDYADALEGKAFMIYMRLWQGIVSPEEAWQEARPWLERAQEVADQSAFAFGLTAGFQMFLEDYPKAEAALQRALTINPSDTWAMVHLSRLMERTGRIDEAVKLARHNVRLDPLNAFRHLQLANRLWTAGDYDGGKASFERALELDPLNYAVWRDYSRRLANKEGELAAFRLLARLQKNPEFRDQFAGPKPELAPVGVAQIAMWLDHIGDYDRERELLQLQSRMGDSAELHRELARSHLARGELEQARDETRIALAGMPRNDISNLLLAIVTLRGGVDPEQALAHFRQYWPGLFETPPAIDTAEELVLISTALVLLEYGNEEQGVAILNAMLDGNAASLAGRAIALAHLGDLAGALDALEAHVAANGYFSYQPGYPLWAPLVNESRFAAIVEAKKARDTLAREQVAQMIERGELLLPGGG